MASNGQSYQPDSGLLDSQIVTEQLELLSVHRRRLGHLFRQRALLADHVPAHILIEIEDIQAKIRPIKSMLRSAQVSVEDMPHDDATAALLIDNTSLPADIRSRRRLLSKVRSDWIGGVLDQSTRDADSISLMFAYLYDAVDHSLADIVQEATHSARVPAQNASIVEAYDSLDGELLILGEPGAGKTTLLLELARELLLRAEKDFGHPVPVILNLASWARHGRPIAEWLMLELNERYRIPRTVARSWVDNDQLLLLLDGLDEVEQGQRQACVLALNAFRREHGMVQMLICSRAAEYAQLAKKLQIGHAIKIEPLSDAQIDTCLAAAGESFGQLRRAIASDRHFAALARSPLMLNVMMQSYKDIPVEQFPATGTAEQLREQLFARYVARTFQRRGLRWHYSPDQTCYWLSFLAAGMQQFQPSTFFIERLQPEWLTTQRARRQYSWLDRLGSALCCGLLIGASLWLIGVKGLELPLLAVFAAMIGGLYGGDASAASDVRNLGHVVRNALKSIGLSALIGAIASTLAVIFLYALTLAPLAFSSDAARVFKPVPGFFPVQFLILIAIAGLIILPIGGAIIFALFGALVGVIVGAPSLRLRRIMLVEQLHWSWAKAKHSARRGFVGWSVFAAVLMLLNAIPSLGELFQAPTIWEGLLWVAEFLIGLVLTTGLFGILGGILAGLFNSFAGGEIEEKVRPNQGIYRSARSALTAALRTSTIICVIFALITLVIMLLVALFGAILLYANWPSLTRVIPSIYGRVDQNTLISFAIAALPNELISVAKFALTVGAGVGLFGALISALANGGYACFSHLALRIVLWHSGYAPWNYARFLDFAAERILLRKVGGGYIFMHRLLLEYFASLPARPGVFPPVWPHQ